MPGYGQNTKIPTPRNVREAPVPPIHTRNTRPTTAGRPPNPPPSSSTPRSRTYTKSKPHPTANSTGAQGGAGTSAAVENKDPNTSTPAGPPSKPLGSYGQRYANKKINPSSAISPRPQTAADTNRWKLALAPTPPAPPRPSKVQVTPASRVEHKRPSTSVPRSKKTAANPATPTVDINANSRVTLERKLEAAAPTKERSKCKKASKSGSRTTKKATRNRSKEGGRQETSSQKCVSEGNQQSSSEDSVSSDLSSNNSNASNLQKEDENRKPEAVSLSELPKLNLFDISLSRGFGPTVHIDSVPAQSTLSLDKLPEYTLKKDGVFTAKHVEVYDGISIDEISPPPELHSVLSDPKLQDYLTLKPVTPSPPPESIADMKQPHLIASEESLQAEAPAMEPNTLSDIASIPTESIPDGSPADENILQDFPPEDEREEMHVPSVDETNLIGTFGTAVISAADLNCYEINSKENYEYLGNLVRIPKGITLTKDVPPLYVGVFSVQNSSQEDLIFKVKTRTQSANIYAINPKLGSLARTSTKVVKVQADFTKGTSPSTDMLKNNLVVLVASAPPVKMTRKEMEKFWKLLQDQQDGGKSSFYVHTVEDIQLVNYDDPLRTGITNKTEVVVKRKPSPLVIPDESPRVSDPLTMSLVDTDIVDNTSEPEEPSFDDVYADQSINEVTQDVRQMTGSMNSLLRWGCISIYATSVLGVLLLVYHNANDGADLSDNGGLLNWFSSWREKFPADTKKHS